MGYDNKGRCFIMQFINLINHHHLSLVFVQKLHDCRPLLPPCLLFSLLAQSSHNCPLAAPPIYQGCFHFRALALSSRYPHAHSFPSLGCLTKGHLLTMAISHYPLKNKSSFHTFHLNIFCFSL